MTLQTITQTLISNFNNDEKPDFFAIQAIQALRDLQNITDKNKTK